MHKVINMITNKFSFNIIILCDRDKILLELINIDFYLFERQYE